MLGILLIYWIGNSFYTLAKYKGKSEWGFAFAGVGVYYGAQIFIWLLIYILEDAMIISVYNNIALRFVPVVLSGLLTYLFYEYLKKTWSAQPAKESNPDILDDIV